LRSFRMKGRLIQQEGCVRDDSMLANLF